VAVGSQGEDWHGPLTEGSEPGGGEQGGSGTPAMAGTPAGGGYGGGYVVGCDTPPMPGCWNRHWAPNQHLPACQYLEKGQART